MPDMTKDQRIAIVHMSKKLTRRYTFPAKLRERIVAAHNDKLNRDEACELIEQLKNLIKEFCA